ncbi:RGS7 [Cordylochernes scorpioides]|uniref:RGS7 n=1 Tax=Cordylochernes scorpioides TaxID=51811 RepID=A0ABY6KNX1_9ARAC|nr:RGS7 [Cordylochernes scorpioides]
MSAHGYLFPIEDHVLTVRADGTFYRFQTPYFWPSNCWEPENTDYVNDKHLCVFHPYTTVYLCKRTMQNKTRLELADYEAENLARLQKMFSRKWEFIFMQAEAQAKWVGETTGEGARGVRPWRCRVDKKRDKLERKVLDSQERAFWDVHRPACNCVQPGCVNTTEIDIKKACRMNKPIKSSKHMQCSVSGGRLSPSVSEADLSNPAEALMLEYVLSPRAAVTVGDPTEPDREKQCQDQQSSRLVSSSYCCLYLRSVRMAALQVPGLLRPVPGIRPVHRGARALQSLGVGQRRVLGDGETDPISVEFWEIEKQTKDVPPRRVKRWAFSLKELLRDPAGREQFFKFLEKEFSAENLK